jgi:hypothetical protein
MRTPEETRALHEILGRRQYESERAGCMRQIKAHENGVGGIKVDLWRRRLVDNERLREQFIPDYDPLPLCRV